MPQSIKVNLNTPNSYSFHVGMNIWDEVINFFAANYSNRKLFIAIDANVNQLHGEKIESECRRYFQSCHIIEIPEGEKSKSVSHWVTLQDELLQNGVERSTPLLAVGGGVTGDLAGFSGASVLRGIPLIHMPTSLLAMVDSSIGGKTGVNHSKGKNLIGAFYQPDAVFADVAFLKTLAEKEWVGGLAEMLKYAAIRSPEMFSELEEAVKKGFTPTEQWLNLIHKSAAIKISIVEEDVHEAGKRAFLNFGHTFGHALEKLSGFGNISHGEAVFIGMIAATHLSKRLGAAVDEVRFASFKPLYNVNSLPQNTIPELIKAMKHDKKVKEETIRLVLLENWGVPYIKKSEDVSALKDAWKAAFNLFK